MLISLLTHALHSECEMWSHSLNIMVMTFELFPVWAEHGGSGGIKQLKKKTKSN